MKILSGSSNRPMAQAIADKMGLQLTEVDISTFANGETRVWIKEEVKGENIILVQSFSHPTDDYIIECLLLIDALERLGARHVNVVIPWMGYSLQDKVFRPGEAIAAKVVADLISHSYVKRAFLLDLHNSSTPGFFSIPTQHLSALNLFAEYAEQHFDLSRFVIASPDFGGLKRARVFAERLQLDLVNIDKHRNLHTGKVEAVGISGDVSGKSVIIFDDLINSGSTVVTAAEILKDQGANEVHFFATHGPLVPTAYQTLQESLVDSVVVSNSINHSGKTDKVKILDVSSLFATELATWQRSKNILV
jgi:ribose-phosphate pyrophosphokinase